jgi:hypothetical protein
MCIENNEEIGSEMKNIHETIDDFFLREIKLSGYGIGDSFPNCHKFIYFFH